MRHLRTLLTGVAAAVALVVISAPTVAWAKSSAVSQPEAPDLRAAEVCQGKADNPHYSDGAGGIIFKIRATCRETTKITSVDGRLWKCPKAPTGDESSWKGQACTVVAQHSYRDQVVQTGQTGTWYVPPAGQPGVHGAGHWVGVAVFSANGNTAKVRSESVPLDR